MEAPRADWGERAVLASKCIAIYDPSRRVPLSAFLSLAWKRLQIDRLRRETKRDASKRAIRTLQLEADWIEAKAPALPAPGMIGCDCESLMLYARGLTFRQIGVALGIPLQTAKSRVQRIRDAIGDEPGA